MREKIDKVILIMLLIILFVIVIFSVREMIIKNNNKQFYKRIVKIKEENNNDKLLDELKKDPDYGSMYTCDIYDNEVKCFITDFMENTISNIDKDNGFVRRYKEFTILNLKFKRLLDKFNIKYKTNILMIKNISFDENVFEYASRYIYNIKDNNSNIINKIDVINALYSEKDNALYMVPFSKLDLLNKKIDNNEFIVIEMVGKNTSVRYGI